ncbi:SH3 domain-containing protein [Marivita sp.]|uniref:SH3 domain-containing protein n=1 Tax=Marivita sp. TaxID=2003365 RepID=UPI0025BEC1A2|nr:SH3 domain-containing protein [Marivita sp.]
MNKYIWVAFAFMGVGFYEMSGGSDFQPGETTVEVFADPRQAPEQARPEPSRVARADTTATRLTEIAPIRVVATPSGTGAKPTSAPDSPEPDRETLVDTAPEPEVPADTQAVLEEAAPDLRFVDGDRVNMRGGPGTDYAVIGKLQRNDMVEVIEDEGDGWLRLRETLTGNEGWIADWLVTASN